MKIQNLNALITGASRGLGRALAFELAARGARVVVASRTEAELRAVETELRRRGATAFAVVSDVSDKRAIHPLAAQAAALAGPIDLLVNNASTLGPVPLKPLLDTECEDLEAALATNLVGPMRLTKAVLGNMILRGAGLVLNVSSDAAVSAYPSWGAYSASKAALDHLTRVWAEELKGTPVKLLSLDPGEMDTRMHADAIPDADRASLARPEEIARAIAELIGKSETLENGARIVVPEWSRSSDERRRSDETRKLA